MQLEFQLKASQLRNRITFGLGTGVAAGGIVLDGGWVFAVALAASIFTASVNILNWFGVGELLKG